MGLAALGDPDRFYDAAASLVTIDTSGGIQMDLSYFDFQRWAARRTSARFVSTFGPPRAFDGPFESRHIDLAAAFQRVLEERTLQLCCILQERTQCKQLVFAGGVSRNDALNQRLSQETVFDELFVMPATGETGPAIEAAFYVFHRIMEPRRSAVPMDLVISGNAMPLDVDQLVTLQMLPTIPDASLESPRRPASKKRQGLIWHAEKITRVVAGDGETPAAFVSGGPGRLYLGVAEGTRPRELQLFIPTASRGDKRRIINYLEDRSLVLVITDCLPEEMALAPGQAEVSADAPLEMDLQMALRTDPFGPGLNDPGIMARLGNLFGVPKGRHYAFHGSGEAVAASPINAIRCFFSQGIDSLLIGNFVSQDRS
jgi:carbamoyltransferase